MQEKEWDLPLKVFLAEKSKERRRGLIGERSIDWALLLPFCPLVHTFGMKKEIDILFLRGGKIHKIYQNVPPKNFRGSFAFNCLEMPSGSIKKYNLQKGDILSIR